MFKLEEKAVGKANEKILDLLIPPVFSKAADNSDNLLNERTRQAFRHKLSNNELDNRYVEIIEEENLELIDAKVKNLWINQVSYDKQLSFNSALVENIIKQFSNNSNLYDTIQLQFGNFAKKKRVTVKEAKVIFFGRELKKLTELTTFIEESYDFCTSQPKIEEIRFIEKELIDIIKKDFSQIYKFTSYKFEELVCEILYKMGYKINQTSKTRDGGCDLFAIYRDALGIDTVYVVEAKHLHEGNKVGVNVVRELYSVKEKFKGHHGMIVTSSFFTKDAIRENEEYYKIHLKDQKNLMDLLKNIKT